MSNQITIPAPNMQTAVFGIVGIAPLMTARFSKKMELMAKMAEGKTAGSKRGNREARDYEKEAEDAAYRAESGEYGVNAASFRNGMISACRLVGFKMTLAKLSLFVEADGYDARDGTPLVFIEGKWEANSMHVRNATGVVDVRTRPQWAPGWKATLRVRFDADQFQVGDVANLLARVGLQGGIGEGRPDSKSSAGLGYGLFALESEAANDVGETAIAAE